MHKTNLDFLLKNKSTRHSRFWTDFWLFPWRPGCPLLCCELQEQICSWLQARFWMRMSPGAERWTPWPPGCCGDVEPGCWWVLCSSGLPEHSECTFYFWLVAKPKEQSLLEVPAQGPVTGDEAAWERSLGSAKGFVKL